MFKYECSCGSSIMFYNYTIHLEGSLTFRRYIGECSNCLKEIGTMDIHENDLLEQEYPC